MENNSMESLKIYIDEIKVLRDEMNWRLRLPYTAPIYYVSALFVVLGISLRFLESNSFPLDKSGLLLLAIAFAICQCNVHWCLNRKSLCS